LIVFAYCIVLKIIFLCQVVHIGATDFRFSWYFHV